MADGRCTMTDRHVHTDVRQYGLQCTYFQSLDSPGGSCSDFYTTELRAGVLNGAAVAKRF